MSQFQIHTIESAPEEAKDALKAVQNANGFIPNLIGVLANAPTALETYRTVGGINGRNSLTGAEREVVQITAAVVNGCGFCVAGHTKPCVTTRIILPKHRLTRNYNPLPNGYSIRFKSPIFRDRAFYWAYSVLLIGTIFFK